MNEEFSHFNTALNYLSCEQYSTISTYNKNVSFIKIILNIRLI